MIITELIRKSISVMRTQRSQRALMKLAQSWARSHNSAIDPQNAVQRFQLILQSAEQDRHMWPITVMDWLMDDLDDANFHHDVWDLNGRGQMYPIHDDVLTLNGVVCHFPCFFCTCQGSSKFEHSLNVTNGISEYITFYRIPYDADRPDMSGNSN